jgi:hypothetical protein
MNIHSLLHTARQHAAGCAASLRSKALAPMLAAAAMSTGGYGIVTTFPGESHRGPLPALNQADQDLAGRLRRHVESIAVAEHNLGHPQELERVALYLENVLTEQGHAVRRQQFGTDRGPARNLEVTIAGKGGKGRSEIIVVGAHYDSVFGSPGANDNASGAAAILELARMLRGVALPPQAELRLVLYANEEPPYFKTRHMGSLVHARSMHARKERVSAMISLETLGFYSDDKESQRYPAPLNTLYPDTGNFVGFVADIGSRQLVQRVITLFRQHAAFPSEGIAAPAEIPGIDWSDHWSYRQIGAQALMVTDTAPYRYPHYHKASDTPDKVDYEKLARVVAGLEKTLRAMLGAK